MNFLIEFAKIDSNQAWLAPLLPIHQAFKNSFDGGELSDWLNGYFCQQGVHIHNSHGISLHFTSQSDLPHGTAYEQFIHQTGKIPTRNNLHDWFGACIWYVFARTKALLNAKHIANFDKNVRNRLRDTITIFDENGAVLVVCDDDTGHAIGHSLQHFNWQGCLIDTRSQWHDPQNPKDSDKAQLFIFGHALLEQLTCPRKPLCSHTLIINMPQTFFALDLPSKLTALDKRLCQILNDLLIDGVTPRCFSPLPILGVPHFWQENLNADFYQDSFVFRSGRKNSNT